MKLPPLALALCLCLCAACAPEEAASPAPEPASSSAGEPGFGLPTIWAEAPGIRWSLAEMPEDALIWMSPGLELEGTLARCWENLWLFAYYGPWEEGFASPEEWDYVELIRSCVFRTARLKETPALEAVCRAHGLSPALAAGGIPPEHVQQTVDTILAGEILVDPERFEKERRNTAGNSVGYDPEYQLFFIQASYFPPRLLAILDWDEAAMELTMTYVEKGYDTLYTVDGLAISGGNGDSEPYPGTLEDYVTGEAPRYRVAFDGECRIRSILPLEGSEAFPDSGESSAPPASPSQSAGQSDPNNFAPVDALCDYLLENLSPSQYTSISRQRDRDNNSNLVAEVWTPDRAPVEALVAAYPGEPAPVKYVDTQFSKAEQDAALEAVNAFFEEHPEIPLICVNRWYDQVMIYLEAPSEALEAFIAESALEEIYLVEVYPGGVLPENPD